MKNILKISLLVVSIFLLSCSSSDDDNPTSISDSILSGTVSGENFTAIGGKAFESGNKVSINITNITTACSSSILDYNLYVSTEVTLQVGTYENVNIVFHKDGETPLNYLGGTVIVEEVTNTSVTVKIKANSNSEDTVEGKFTVDYCN